jgi:NADPH:quinone reductase
MKAIIIKAAGQLVMEEVPQPDKAAPGHLIIQMLEMGINGGDHLLIGGTLPPDFFPASKFNIAGVSGVGKVIATGEGVPDVYQDQYVTVYRSLKSSEHMTGTWSEFAHLHYLQCAILQENIEPTAYSGSLVNIVTPYAFFQQIQQEGHQGIINTAGNSATGKAMIGIGIAYYFPVISLVRNEQSKAELQELGAENVLITTSPDFKEQLRAEAARLNTTAVFDGVGGAVLTDMMDVLPARSTIYCYGYLGGKTPLTFHTSLLTKGISIRGFGNFQTATVRDPEKLSTALTEISKLLPMPHFKTQAGQKFAFEQIGEAMNYKSEDGAKAILKVR